MNEFDAVVHSLGEHLVDGIGKEHLTHVLVSPDELTATAEVTIVLSERTWAEQERAIDKIVDLREMFLEEISFDYRFAPEPDGRLVTTSTKAEQLEFV